MSEKPQNHPKNSALYLPPTTHCFGLDYAPVFQGHKYAPAPENKLLNLPLPSLPCFSRASNLPGVTDVGTVRREPPVWMNSS